MNRAAFPYRDFVRVKGVVRAALCEQDEPYVLVTGETGTGKTVLMRELRSDLDRARYRVFYFAGAQKLGATGLVRVMARALRISVSTCHYESLDKLTHTLATDETQKILLWFDEAHDLPHETLAQARALCESDLAGQGRVQVLLVGLPRLRAELLACPPLWRRITVREELAGLVLDELPAFLEHHFGTAPLKRLCEVGQAKLFERGKGSPGLILPLARRVLAQGNPKSRLEPEQIEDILHRFELG